MLAHLVGCSRRARGTAVCPITEKVRYECWNPGIVLVDLRKAFDTVDHAILIDKLSSFGICENELKWFKSYMTNRTQQVDYNGTLSDQRTITTGVPQGSILGPLLFVMFVNDAPDAVKELIDLYADDTTLQAADNDLQNLESKLNSELESLNNWFTKNRLILNTDKTLCIVLSTYQRKATVDNTNIAIKIGQTHIKQVDEAKLLGATIDEHLTWKPHISKMCSKISKKLGLLKRLKRCVPDHTLKMLFNSLVQPHFDYIDIVWGTAADIHVNAIYRMQKRAARILTGAKRFTRTKTLLKQLGWLSVRERIMFHRAVLTFKAIHGKTPNYISSKCIQVTNRYHTRSAQNGDLKVPKPNLEIFKRSFEYLSPAQWNQLDTKTKHSESIGIFKKRYLKGLSM